MTKKMKGKTFDMNNFALVCNNLLHFLCAVGTQFSFLRYASSSMNLSCYFFLRVAVDDESKEWVMRGMGELHLDIYRERLRREYGVEVKLCECCWHARQQSVKLSTNIASLFFIGVGPR